MLFIHKLCMAHSDVWLVCELSADDASADPACSINGERQFWTAGRLNNNFEWRVNKTSSSMTYTQWLDGNPKNLGAEDYCILILEQKGDVSRYLWSDVACSTRNCFVCATEQQ